MEAATDTANHMYLSLWRFCNGNCRTEQATRISLYTGFAMAIAIHSMRDVFQFMTVLLWRLPCTAGQMYFNLWQFFHGDCHTQQATGMSICGSFTMAIATHSRPRVTKLMSVL